MSADDITGPRFTGRYAQGGLYFEDGVPTAIEQGIIGGGANEGDRVNNITYVGERANITRVVGNTETLIASVPARLIAIIAGKGATPSSGYVSVRDAFATGGASTPIMEPDATVDHDGHGVICANGITVQGSAAATDVSVLWRPLS